MTTQNTLIKGEDEKTHDYFDSFTPHYDPKRFQFAIDYLNEHASAEQKLLDIGCGDGATLYLLQQKTPLQNFCGIDISANYLRKAEEMLQCDTIEGSILDDSLVQQHAGQYDYCTLGAVIHHLIGKTRRESFEFAQQCIRNSYALLKPGGSLIIFEPTYTPAWAITMAFWIKKGVTRVTNSRVEIGGKWANFGQPIISYYTAKQIIDLAEQLPGAEIHFQEVLDHYRYAGFIVRDGLGLVINKSK